MPSNWCRMDVWERKGIRRCKKDHQRLITDLYQKSKQNGTIFQIHTTAVMTQHDYLLVTVVFSNLMETKLLAPERATKIQWNRHLPLRGISSLPSSR